jgi:cell fate (sporulation/competence/biofilm development) regulator YlbF (YheA/YmcA/DUF963 family)
MNIYDKLNELVKAIETSDEFLRYKKAAEAVDANPTHAQMAKDFMTLQVQISTAQMLGQQPDQATIDRFNSTYTSIAGISDVNEFLQAQMAFSKIMEDVSKALSKTAMLDVDFLKIIPNPADED